MQDRGEQEADILSQCRFVQVSGIELDFTRQNILLIKLIQVFWLHFTKNILLATKSESRGPGYTWETSRVDAVMIR